MNPARYPVGLQDFSEIRRLNKVYVDKTQFIHRLLHLHKYYFLSRPRRFGKSLLVSTMEYLFKGKRDLFEGLFIYDKWDFQEYPVIRISFSDIGYRTSNLTDAINLRLNELARNYSLILEHTDHDKRFRELIHKLEKAFNKKVVVLIDEYDKPLIDYLDKDSLPQARENRSVLKSFYSVLKDADPYLKLVFITGVSKFSQVSIFSDLNNLYDLTLRLEFNNICGITQHELQTYFAQELTSLDQDKVKSWYNGYRFHTQGDTLYNPFSILNFFSSHGEFMNYWYSTGTPTFLLNICREEFLYDFDNTLFDINDLSNFDIDNLKLIPILFQTGYLTLKASAGIDSLIYLGYPNREVKESYLRNLADTYIQNQRYPASHLMLLIYQSFQTQDPEKLRLALNHAFDQIPYDLWRDRSESFFHAIVHLLFSLLGMHIFSEVHTSRGRADSIVVLDDNVYCLEFKLDGSAEEALQQIDQKGYLDRWKNSGKHLHKIGINFSSQSRQVAELLWV